MEDKIVAKRFGGPGLDRQASGQSAGLGQRHGGGTERRLQWLEQSEQGGDTCDRGEFDGPIRHHLAGTFTGRLWYTPHVLF